MTSFTIHYFVITTVVQIRDKNELREHVTENRPSLVGSGKVL